MGREAPDDENAGDDSPSLEVCIRLPGDTFYLNRRHVVSKSSTLAKLLQASRPGQQPPATCVIPDVPADVETFRIAALFFIGRDPAFTAGNAIPVACVADYLGMTESHFPDNLLRRSLSFLSGHVLPRWDDTVLALSAALAVHDHAARLGLIEACIGALATMAADNPGLLEDAAGVGVSVGVGVKRRLFEPAEDVTLLHPRLYVPVMRAVVHAGVPSSHVARCAYRYLRRWAGVGTSPEAEPVSMRAQQKDVVEAVERLLPLTTGAMHVKQLFEILRRATALEVSPECQRRLEARVARQLAQAQAEDLFLPRRGYAAETEHDVECARRIMAEFCSAAHCAEEAAAAAGVLEKYLAAAAGEASLRKETFGAMAAMLAAVETEAGWRADGVYRVVDTYLVAHGHMTVAEREELCRVLDVKRLSSEACEHAARNERLPVRVVTQVLLVEQLRIREVIASVLEEVEEEEEEEEKEMVVVEAPAAEEDVEEEEKGLVEAAGRCERCGGGGGGDGKRRKKKRGFWREMVRWNFGCKEGTFGDECNCHIKTLARKRN